MGTGESLPRKGQMVVMSGPSGAGKSTLCRRLLEDPRVHFSISATTQPVITGESQPHVAAASPVV